MTKKLTAVQTIRLWSVEYTQKVILAVAEVAFKEFAGYSHDPKKPFKMPEDNDQFANDCVLMVEAMFEMNGEVK